MASELNVLNIATGETLYACIRTTSGQMWSTVGSALEARTVANWANYDIALTETPASSYFHVGDWPASLTAAGFYFVDIYRQDGAGPAIADTQIAMQYGHWDGTTYKQEAADTVRVRGTAQTAGDIIAAISAIGSGTGAALNFAPDDDNVDGAIVGAPVFDPLAPFVGVQTSGTFASASADDGTYHQIDDTTNEIDIIYQFSVGAGRNCAKVVFTGYMGTATADTSLIKAYNFVTGAWDTRGTLIGQNTSTDKVQDVTLLSAHTGTGTYAGKVYIRFDSTATNQVLYVDSLIAQAQNLGQTVGYSDGSIWVDTVAGTAGTTPFVNGTADNPVDTWADALTLAASVGIRSFHFSPGSSITLTGDSSKYRFIGPAIIALNGQAIADAFFQYAYTISGTSTGDDAEFYNCGIGTATIAHGYFIDCRFKGTLTFVAANDYIIIRGSDSLPGSATSCQFTFAANVDAVFREWTGGIQLNSMAASNTAIIDGSGRVVIDASSTAGTITIRGHFNAPTGQTAFNAGGGVVSDDARWATDQEVNVGTGARTVTVTVDDGADPIEGATVRLTKGIDSVSGLTNASGEIILYVDDGTWSWIATMIGYDATTGTQVVNGNEAFTTSLTNHVPTPATDPSQSNAWVYCYDGQGAAEASVKITFQLLTPPYGQAKSYDGDTFDSGSSAADGLIEFALLQNATYQARRGATGDWVEFTVPAASTYALPQTLGQA